MFNAVFNLSYVFYVFLIIFSCFVSILYYLQLDDYNKKSITKSLCLSFKDNYLNIMLYVLMLFLIDRPYDYSGFFLLLILNFAMIVSILLGSKFKYIDKVKYTKRVIRLCVCSLILFLIIISLIMLLIANWLLVILFPVMIFLSYVILYLSLLIMSPIENMINNYYIKLAKAKLSDNKNLTKIAITGSFGKTSTKVILNSILSENYSTLATEKSYNTPMGISKSINDNLKSTHEVFVCEMGAKKKGEIKELCDMVVPDIGVVVSVGRQHMKTFLNIDNVYQTKKELPDSLIQKKCVFNLDNAYVRKMYNEYVFEKIGVFVIYKRDFKFKRKVNKSKKINRFVRLKNIIYYFYNKKDCVYAKNIVANSGGVVADVYYSGKFLFKCESDLIGLHNLTNILLAVGVGVLMNVSPEKISIGIKKVNRIGARLEKKTHKNGATVINNGYNSNLDSAEQTLSVLKMFPVRNKVVVTPGIVECSDNYIDNKSFARIISKFATKVIIVGEYNLKALKDGLIENGFNENNIIFKRTIFNVYDYIDNADENWVFLIENDLPENYR